jgi:predicted MFS family arabinose efflux permease
MPPVLWALLFGNFVIGCGVNVVPGTLPEISASLGVPVAQAGQLITASALVVALCAPLFAAIVAGWDRRRLLALAMAWFGLLHLACAAMPELSSLLAARMLAMVAPAIFTPQAAACVGLLVPAERRGRAITFVFLGFSLASVVGLPIGAYVGGTFGWRAAFALVGAMGIANGIWIFATMPAGVKPAALSREAWGRTLRSPAVMSCLAVTLVFGSGQFILYSYLAPYLKLRVGFSTTELSLMLVWFGVFGLAGNALMSRSIDRIGPARAVMISLGLGALTLLAWPLGTGFALVAVVIVPWALGYFSSNSAQQARLAGIAPSLASASIALNTSAIYAGQGIGAAIGGLLIAHGHWDVLHWAAMAGMLLAMAVSAFATRLSVIAPGSRRPAGRTHP